MPAFRNLIDLCLRVSHDTLPALITGRLRRATWRRVAAGGGGSGEGLQLLWRATHYAVSLHCGL